MDKIRNEYIRGTTQVGKFGEKTREARLRWYVHRRRKDDGYIGRRMLLLSCPSHHFSHLRAHAIARSVTVARSSTVQTPSGRRQERRWAIVCGSPQSQSTDWASSR